MGNSPRDCGPGGQWLGFIFIWWELSSWGVVLEPIIREFPNSFEEFIEGERDFSNSSIPT